MIVSTRKRLGIRSRQTITDAAKYAHPKIPISGTSKSPGSFQDHSFACTAIGSIKEASYKTIMNIAHNFDSRSRCKTSRAESKTKGQIKTTIKGMTSTKKVQGASY